MDWVMAYTKGKRVMGRESESGVCENEESEWKKQHQAKKGRQHTFLSVLSFKVERNTIERLD